MRAKFLGEERTRAAVCYMSYSVSLPQIFSTEFSWGHRMITLADNEPPALLSYKVHFGQTFIPTPWRMMRHATTPRPSDSVQVPVTIVTNINSPLDLHIAVIWNVPYIVGWVKAAHGLEIRKLKATNMYPVSSGIAQSSCHFNGTLWDPKVSLISPLPPHKCS